MASLYSILYILALSFLICTCSSKLGRIEDSTDYIVNVHSLLQTDVCVTSSKESNPSTLRLVHRHGPCSNLKPKKQPTLADILNHDLLRLHRLHNHKTEPHSSLLESQIPAQSGDTYGTANYIVTAGFGTPSINQTIVFDTGSDITWIQCKPCSSSCYQQQEPLFNPAQSSTFTNISCSSPNCSALRTPPNCQGSTCLYSVRYGDNSSTAGFFAQDTLTLTPSDKIPNFRFGCGQSNHGLFGQTAGLLGLGRKQSSLVSQTAPKYGGVFSYCLPAHSSSSSGYLTFGPSSSPSQNVSFTPMLSYPNFPSFYFVELMSISLANQTLAISPTLFSDAGTLIDSGTVITRLPPTAYSILRSAFRQKMTQYPLTAPVSLFDTCYDLSKYRTVRIPTMTLNFRGAIMDLAPQGILTVLDISRVCLGFAPNGDDSDLVIIGNTQQSTMNVVYDVSKQVVGFGPPGAC